MKLVRFGPRNAEQPGVWLEPGPDWSQPMLLNVRAMAFDIEDYNAHFFAHHGLERVASLLREKKRQLIPAAGQRLGPPVARPGKIICLGKNYGAHAQEFDARMPTQPILFSKALTALNGPFDPIILPAADVEVDGEVELAVVIGRSIHQANQATALQAIAGYTVLNDLTDRRAQRADGQWFRAKSANTFCPLGPYLVTPDEIPDPHQLRLRSVLNGQPLQDGHTADMLFKLPFLLEFISASITLEPGDILATGTPAGVGSARRPPIILRAGDTLETIVEGIGHQKAAVVSPSATA